MFTYILLCVADIVGGRHKHIHRNRDLNGTKGAMLAASDSDLQHDHDLVYCLCRSGMAYLLPLSEASGENRERIAVYHDAIKQLRFTSWQVQEHERGDSYSNELQLR